MMHVYVKNGFQEFKKGEHGFETGLVCISVCMY